MTEFLWVNYSAMPKYNLKLDINDMLLRRLGPKTNTSCIYHMAISSVIKLSIFSS